MAAPRPPPLPLPDGALGEAAASALTAAIASSHTKPAGTPTVGEANAPGSAAAAAAAAAWEARAALAAADAVSSSSSEAVAGIQEVRPLLAGRGLRCSITAWAWVRISVVELPDGLPSSLQW
jgi:hypothetical protein